MNKLYQFAILGSVASEVEALKQEVVALLGELKLNVARDVAFYDHTNHHHRNRKFPMVAAYIGDVQALQPIVDAVEEQVKANIFVLPIFDASTDYANQVPPGLHHINGMKRSEGWAAAAGKLLQEIGLTRARRAAFISYKRSESSEVALQLYHALDDRLYQVFLDTHAIEAGKHFQDELWDSMSDMDMVILLDSPNALQSTWVQQEIIRANKLGLGILQLVWPNHTPTASINLGTAHLLKTSNFIGGDTLQKLEDPVLQDCLQNIEALRARSFASRQTRLYDELARRALGNQRQVIRDTNGDLLVPTRKGTMAVIKPLLGHPGSIDLQQLQMAVDHPTEKREGAYSRLLYDPLGMRADRQDHLVWLNQHMPFKSMQVGEVNQWLIQLP